MKHSKFTKGLAALLVIVMVIGLLPVMAAAAETIQVTTQENLTTAVTNAADGDVIEITAAGTYTFPKISKYITIRGTADDVIFNCNGSGSVTSTPNGAIFENITMNFGGSAYHGFQHAGKIIMKGCTLNGLFNSYGDMDFTDCIFNAPGTEASGVASVDYSMWCYGKDVTYTDCVFNGAGKFLNIYNEGNDDGTPWKIKATDCTFYSTKLNKAPFNIKEMCTNGKYLKYDVTIENCKIGAGSEANFPSAKTEGRLLVLSPLVQVDDRAAAGNESNSGITVRLDGNVVYANGQKQEAAPAVAKIGTVEYATLAEAVAAVKDNETIVMLQDVTLDTEIAVPDGKTFTIDLNSTTLKTTAVTGFSIDSANLTVKNGTVKNTNDSGLSGRTMETRTKAFFLWKSGEGSLTLDEVEVESTGYSVNADNDNEKNGAQNKKLIIKDCDISSGKWAAVYAGGKDASNELSITNTKIHSSWTGTTMAALQICMKATLEKTTVTNDYGSAVSCFVNTDLLVKGTENSFIGAAGAIATNGSHDLDQITIEGGVFKSTGTSGEAGIAFYHPDGSPLTIKGGIFEGATALYVKGGTIDIQGGTFTGTGAYAAAEKIKSGAKATGDAIAVEASNYLQLETYEHEANPDVTISNGEFKSTNAASVGYYTFDDNAEVHNGKMIYGGYYSNDVTAYIAEGYKCIDNPDSNKADYPFKVVKDEPTPVIVEEVKEIITEGTPGEGKVVVTSDEEVGDEAKAVIKEEAQSLAETTAKVAVTTEADLSKAVTGKEAVVKKALEEAAKEQSVSLGDEEISKQIKIDLTAMKVTVAQGAATKVTSNTVEYDVKPLVTTTIIKDGAEPVIVTTQIPNSAITEPIPFRLGVDNAAAGQWAKVTRRENGQTAEQAVDLGTYPVQGNATDGYYVELASDHFSIFTATMTETAPSVTWGYEQDSGIFMGNTIVRFLFDTGLENAGTIEEAKVVIVDFSKLTNFEEDKIIGEGAVEVQNGNKGVAFYGDIKGPAADFEGKNISAYGYVKLVNVEAPCWSAKQEMNEIKNRSLTSYNNWDQN